MARISNSCHMHRIILNKKKTKTGIIFYNTKKVLLYTPIAYLLCCFLLLFSNFLLAKLFNTIV